MNRFNWRQLELFPLSDDGSNLSPGGFRPAPKVDENFDCRSSTASVARSAEPFPAALTATEKKWMDRMFDENMRLYEATKPLKSDSVNHKKH